MSDATIPEEGLGGDIVATRSRAQRQPVPRLDHDEVVARFVDYHFGRLAPEMDRAVEAHVRSCPQCQREGLRREVADRRRAQRKLAGVRGGRRRKWNLGRPLVSILMGLALVVVLVYFVTTGRTATLVTLVTGEWKAPTLSAPPITAIDSNNRLSLATQGAVAIALSPDGGDLAISEQGGQPSISLWPKGANTASQTFTWSGAPAATLAWSSDGKQLAAASAGHIHIWDVTSGQSVWSIQLPSAPAIRVYDVSQRQVVSRPDPAATLLAGPVMWGPDGALNAAPDGAAGVSGAVPPQGPLVGLWASAGSHVFVGASGQVQVGSSQQDAARGDATLSWSVDGRYLLWAAVAPPVTLPPAGQSADHLAPPDATVGQIAATVGRAGSAGDALIWFAPSGNVAALCMRNGSGAPQLTITALTDGHTVDRLPVACAGLTTHSAIWSADSATLVVASAKQPVTYYTIPR